MRRWLVAGAICAVMLFSARPNRCPAAEKPSAEQKIEEELEQPTEEPTPQAPPPPALAASNLAIQGFGFSDAQFLLEAGFTAVGPGDAPLCVASVFSNQGEGPLQDQDGEFALGGLVAVTGAPVTPGTQPEQVAISHTLPVSQLDLDRGTVQVVASTRIWAGSCDSVDPGSRPLAEAVSEAVCVTRLPGGWYPCRK